MFKKILDIIKSLKLNNKQLVAFLALSILVITGMGTYILNQKPEVKSVDNTLQIELKTLSSEFYRFKKYEIEKDALRERSHEIDINNLQKEFDAKVILVADHLESVESKRVKDMLEFAESVKPKEIPIPTEPQESIEHPIPTDIVELYTDEINVAHNIDTLSIKDTIIKKPFLKRVFGIFKRDTLK